jgi:ACS family hexuronate transporter-like MFS transporter
VAGGTPSPRFGYRWTILALLFGATTVNYIDRQVLGILAPTLTRELGWSEADYGAIVSWFSIAYAIGLFFVGRLMDRIGVRRGYPLSIVVWSLAAMGHALVRTVTGFSAMRALLAVGESGNFPCALKTVAEWFPKKERALAAGIFNAGSNVGVVVAALMVPWVALSLGWRWAFVATGSFDLLWLIAWLLIYREPGRHPRLSETELAYIRSDPAEPAGRVPWGRLLGYRQTWAYVIGKAMTDPVWLFYLFWLPKFLDTRWKVHLSGLALPLVVIYVAADVGSVAGGWISTALIERGLTVNRGRKTAMLIAAILIVPTMLAPRAGSMWAAVAIVSVAAASHQWWSANLLTFPSDMFPKQAVGSVVGIGGFAGMFSAFLFQRFTGALLQATGGNYTPIFAVLGLAYLSALALIHLLVPRMEPAAIQPG